MMNFPTRQENIPDLVFTSHPEYKIRCTPLPPIGEKSDHDIVLYDTSHQVFRARPPRRKMFLWKKANLDGIRKSISSASSNFMDTEFDGIEAMWAALKIAVTTSLEEHVPTKMSSTRCTHPWVSTNFRRMMERKQRAHKEVKSLVKPKIGTGTRSYSQRCNGLLVQRIDGTW